VEDFFSRYLVDWEAHVDLVAKVRQTRQYHQTIIHHKDGRIIDMSGKMVNVRFIRHGALEIYTLRDITEEVHSRQKMLAMQLTVDNLSEPVVWSDLRGKITYVNQAACAALGYDGPAEIIGKTVWRFYQKHQSDDGVNDTWNTTLAALRKNQHAKFDHTILVRKDGTTLPCTVLIDCITQDGSSFLAMCFHDLSEQIRRIEAERTAEAKSEFLARMSHEIRTPMNAIIGLSEMARREYGSPKGFEYITDIKSAGRNLIAVINDILDFSKIESGRLDIVASPYETASLLHDALTIIRVKLAETPLELILDISPELPAVMIGDAGRIRQILLNLLSNAVKYTKKGFIRFSASQEAISDDTVRLTFVVEDSGIGIRQDDLPKLFEKFSRIDERRHINVEGSGLGLVISRNLCRAMDGDITVQSEYGKGSVFAATLTQTVADWNPAGDVTAASVPRTQEQCATFTAPDAEVLIVDDFPSNLLVAEGLLAPYGMRVSTCQNGREAVELVRKRPFDLILMDHMMPEMDGVEATHAIRGMNGECRRTMPVIALTANAMSGMREMFLKNGFNDFLAKPIEMAELDAVLKKWIPPEKRLAAGRAVHSGEASAPGVIKQGIVKGLDVEKGIKNVGGRKSAYADVLSVFRRDCGKQIYQLRLALAAQDLPAYAISAHALKGSLRTIGAERLAFSAMMLEKAAARGDVGFLKEETRFFLEELQTLVDVFDLVMPSLGVQPENDVQSGGESPLAGASPLKLDVLKKALGSRDVRTVNDLLAEYQNMALSPGQRTLINDIDTLVMAFEFDEAIKKIDGCAGRGS
ncbi:MAG: response regulator, partial [Desulfovibrio sp.]|nr:response regulator [Desulfovibrio sp.]